jgi:hypothetical protein
MGAEAAAKDANSAYINKSTRIFVLLLGVIAGIGGVLHGIYEALRGKGPPADILERIGAFTLIPDYLATGLCSMILGAAMIAWSTAFIHKKLGPQIFLVIALILFLVGGGVALVPGSILVWGVATRIRKPLSWWEKAIPAKARSLLGSIWQPVLAIGLIVFLVGFGIWSFLLPPGELRKVTALHYVLWSCLGCGLLVLIFAIICGFARDIEKRTESPPI